MTSFSLPRRKDTIAADEFEARIEKALLGCEIVYVLDDGTVFRFGDAIIETNSI